MSAQKNFRPACGTKYFLEVHFKISKGVIFESFAEKRLAKRNVKFVAV